MVLVDWAGNLFRVDYLPKIYRKYTYFQIFSINHSITTSGWSTSINENEIRLSKMITDRIDKKFTENRGEERTQNNNTQITRAEQQTFGGLSEKECIKELEKESYGWSGVNLNECSINNDTTLVNSIKGLVDKYSTLTKV